MKQSDRHGEDGMSLVEMLIVLVVIGVMASLATLSIGAATRGATAEAEARRLANTIGLAMDEALVTNRSIAFSCDQDGYAFITGGPSQNAASPAANDEIAARHDLPSPLHLECDTKAAALRIAPAGDGPGATLYVVDRDDVWRVVADGYTAVAMAGRTDAP